jgi:N-acetylmuramoyl-L-alanine amidase
MFKSYKPSFHYISKSVFCALAICIMLFGLWLADSQAASGTINGSVVNVRSAPSSSANITGTLLKDAQVELLSLSGDWYQIKFASLQGFVARELITATTTAAATVVTKTTPKATTPAVTTTIGIPAPSVILNGSHLSFEVPPRIENGRTLVPLRAIFEAMGANVEWDETTRTVTARNSNTTVILPLGSTSPTVNGQINKLEVPAKIINDRTLVPLRFVGEAFGGKVDWNAQTTTITITYTAPPAPAAVTVSGAPVNLREAPLGTAALVGTAVNGETMTVLNEQDGWYQVRRGSLNAWVASWVVEAAAETIEPDPAPAEPAAPVVVEPTPPAVIIAEPTIPEAPDNTLYLARTKDASGITVTISSKTKMEPTIKESSGSIQYTFTDRPLSGLNYFEEAIGSDLLKVRTSSQDKDALISISFPANVVYRMKAAVDGKQLTFFIPNYLISIQESAYGTVGERLIISTLTPVTGTGKLDGAGKLEVTLPGLALTKDAKFSYSSALVSSMTVAGSPANSDDLLITLNTVDLYKYSFAVSGSNNDLNIILLHKVNTAPRGGIVFLDAGHGGRDTGARGSLIDEKVINLAVTLKVGALLQQKGIQVEYSRSDDSFVDLAEISNMANKTNAAISVSIHCNANTSSTPGGTETYFYAPLSNPDLFVQRDDRCRLATLLQTELVKNLQRNNRGVKESNLSVLRNSQMPSALIEMAFISNPDEQALLMSEDFQNLAATAIANAVEQYMNSSN